MEHSATLNQDAGNRNPAEEHIQIAAGADRGTPRPSILIQLSQVSYLRAQTSHYTIFDRRFLSVYRKNFGGKSRQYWIDLALLDSTPHFFVKNDRHSLYTSGGMFGLCAILTLISVFSRMPWYTHAWSPFTLLTLCASVIALLAFVHRSQNLVRFHSQSGDAVLLEMYNNAPNRAEFETFGRELVQHIHAAQRSDRRKPDQKLGAELREHRRLRDQGILTEEVYAAARDKILRRHRQSQMKAPATPQPQAQSDELQDSDIIEVTVSNGKWHTSTSNVDLFAPEKKNA
ncbi:MAG: SHOCT domain-containing protein [Gammaproteobacteria bacterium]|nr:SHOCT domain-containing protein [Gammaproteobacteria bacterium]